MNMKKLLCAACAALLLASCGNNATPDTTGEVTTAAGTDTSDVTEVNTVDVYSGALQEDGGMLDNALQYVKFKDTDLVGYSLPKDVWSLSDAALEKEIATILCSFADSSAKLDREVQLYDTVNIDYVGSIGGVEFEGGSSEGADVVIGITTYIDDFLEQLIGHKPGDVVNVEVTFPENYGKEELNGKDAVFVTTINYIASTPALTDAFVAENLTTYGCQTAAELRALISEEATEEQIAEYISDHLCTVEITELPACYLDYQYALMMEYYRSYASYYGMDTESFLQAAYGVTVDELKAEMADICETQARSMLVAEAAMEKLGMTVGEKELNEYFAESIASGDYDSYVEYYGVPYLKQVVISDTVYQYILKNAVRADS